MRMAQIGTFWKTQIVPYLKGSRLWLYIYLEPYQKPRVTKTEKLIRWEGIDAQSLSTILMNINIKCPGWSRLLFHKGSLGQSREPIHTNRSYCAEYFPHLPSCKALYRRQHGNLTDTHCRDPETKRGLHWTQCNHHGLTVHGIIMLSMCQGSSLALPYWTQVGVSLGH